MSQTKNRVNVGRWIGVASCVALAWSVSACSSGAEPADASPPDAPSADAVAPPAAAHDSREAEAKFVANEAPVAIDVVEAGQADTTEASGQAEELDTNLSTGLTPEPHQPSAAVPALPSEVGVRRSALTTAPRCIDRFGTGNSATVINRCGRTEFVKVVFAFGRDSACTRIPAGAVFTFTSGALAQFDGAFSC